MSQRSSALQRFFDATADDIRAQADRYPDTIPVTSRIFSALAASAGEAGNATPVRLPVCAHLDAAFEQACNGPAADLANAFAAIEPQLHWSCRPGSAAESAAFQDGHANAVIVGDGGLEERNDVRIGVSLVAPGVSYPRHRHPPEEVYIVLAEGKWMQGDGPFAAKRSGDLVHNTPNIWHAMQATAAPLLAVWCLWIPQ